MGDGSEKQVWNFRLATRLKSFLNLEPGSVPTCCSIKYPCGLPKRKGYDHMRYNRCPKTSSSHLTASQHKIIFPPQCFRCKLVVSRPFKVAPKKTNQHGTWKWRLGSDVFAFIPKALAEVGRLQERAKVANQDSDVFVSDFFLNWSTKPTDTYTYAYTNGVLQNVYIVLQILYTYNPSHILMSCGKFIGTFNFEHLSRRTIPVTCWEILRKNFGEFDQSGELGRTYTKPLWNLFHFEISS